MPQVSGESPERVSGIACDPFLKLGGVIQADIAVCEAWPQSDAFSELCEAGLLRQPWRRDIVVRLLDGDAVAAVAASNREESAIRFTKERYIQGFEQRAKQC